MAAGFSRLFNGPQSAGEMGMQCATEGGAKGTGGLCLVFGTFKWALESGGCVRVK